jgi:hypothetical protein
MDEKPKTVTVEALQLHTYNGKSYDVGDTYDIDEQYADSVAAQGKAKRADTKAAAVAKESKPVSPMGYQTRDMKADK